MNQPLLKVVNPETGELTDARCPHCAELEAKVAGYKVTLDKQATAIGKYEREIQRYAEADEAHPQRKEIVALVERWKRATGHPKSKVSKDRVDVIKARLKDGYDLDQLALAIDGIGAYPFVVNGSRSREGKPSQRHDRLGICLGGGEKLEEFARLGYRARQEGLIAE